MIITTIEHEPSPTVAETAEMYEPSYVTTGNHYTILWWWANIRQLRLGGAVREAMKDPGPSNRAQLFVYWPKDSGIEPEVWNAYEFHFNWLQPYPNFLESIKTEKRPAIESFKSWLRLMLPSVFLR
jgi:hypothetical protein